MHIFGIFFFLLYPMRECIFVVSVSLASLSPTLPLSLKLATQRTAVGKSNSNRQPFSSLVNPYFKRYRKARTYLLLIFCPSVFQSLNYTELRFAESSPRKSFLPPFSRKEVDKKIFHPFSDSSDLNKSFRIMCLNICKQRRN